MEYVICWEFFVLFVAGDTNTGWRRYFLRLSFTVHPQRNISIYYMYMRNVYTCKRTVKRRREIERETEKANNNKKENTCKKSWKRQQKAQSIVKLNGTKSLNRIENTLPFLVNSMNWKKNKWIHIYIRKRERGKQNNLEHISDC